MTTNNNPDPLVERLREMLPHFPFDNRTRSLLLEAADALEQKDAELREVREKLHEAWGSR